MGRPATPQELEEGTAAELSKHQGKGSHLPEKARGLPGGAGFLVGPGGGGDPAGRMLRQKEVGGVGAERGRGTPGPVSPSGDLFLGEEPLMVGVGQARYTQRSTWARSGPGCGPEES